MTGQGRDGSVVACGVAVSILGVVTYRFFSPSPHGYLELFIAIPMIVTGLGTAGLGLAFGTFRPALRAIGWFFVGAAGIPVLFALVVFLSVVFNIDW